MELNIIDMPLWLQLVASVACIWLLWKLVTFSDADHTGSGWVGHSGDANSNSDQ